LIYPFIFVLGLLDDRCLFCIFKWMPCVLISSPCRLPFFGGSDFSFLPAAPRGNRGILIPSPIADEWGLFWWFNSFFFFSCCFCLIGDYFSPLFPFVKPWCPLSLVGWGFLIPLRTPSQERVLGNPNQFPTLFLPPVNGPRFPPVGPRPLPRSSPCRFPLGVYSLSGISLSFCDAIS